MTNEKKAERIKELEKARRGEGFLHSKKLKVSDFWLLLEHSSEVTQLIKEIIDGTHCTDLPNSETSYSEEPNLNDQLLETKQEHQKTITELSDIKTQLAELTENKSKLEELLTQAQNAYKNEQANITKLESNVKLLTSEKTKLEELLQQEENARSAAQTTAANLRESVQTLTNEKTALAQQLQQEKIAHNTVQTTVHRLQSEVNTLKGDYSLLQEKLNREQSAHKITQSKSDQHANDLSNRNTEINNLKSEINQLEKKLANANNSVQQAHSELQAIGGTELAHIRQDAKLASALQLENLPDDNTQALIQLVAVLSQKNSVERLWHFLKDRCEAEKRPVTETELRMLESAVSWLSFNWLTHPYSVASVSTGDRYNFDEHTRSVSTPTGEVIQCVYLPGVKQSNGKALYKTLVLTKN